MKRALAIGCGLVAIVLALSWWRCRDPGAPHGPAVGSHASLPPRVVVPQDPGAIAGAVLDDKRAPIAGATVCAGASCVKTDAAGTFRLRDLAPASYLIGASARGFLPGTAEVVLAAGDQRTAIELVLVRGGVELHGMVSDLGVGLCVRRESPRAARRPRPTTVVATRCG